MGEDVRLQDGVVSDGLVAQQDLGARGHGRFDETQDPLRRGFTEEAR